MTGSGIRFILVLTLVFMIAGCGNDGSTPPVNPEPPPILESGSWWQPPPGTTWQWQLSGEIDLSIEAEMFDVDLFDTPSSTIESLHALDRVVICYFSAGSYEDWRPDAGEFPEDVLGDPLDGWPGERWLDISQIQALEAIITARLDLAVAKACDGVEPDNVDGYANDSGFDLIYDHQLAYNQWLSAQAHQRGLSIGLKNDLDQVGDLLPYFDWALNEECFAYDECESLLPFIDAGKAVFGVEYAGKPEDFCPAANTWHFDWLLKHLELDSWGVACRDFGS